jgi:glycosyltransferase involved in cell wall biosynthesis
MKIAFIGGRGVIGKYSGIETYYEEIGSRLVKLGHEVTIYCRPYFTPDTKYYRGMHIKRIPTVRNKYTETIVHSFLSTCHALFCQYDIIQFHALGSSPLAVLPRLAGEKTVVSVQGLDGERAKWGKVAKRYLRACEWAAVHCPSTTSVVSRQLADYYARKYRAPVTYIPNGITPVTAVPPNHIKAFGLGHRDYILFVGRLTPEKGCHDLLEAFKKLDTPYKLVFVGDSTYAQDYVDRLKQDESDLIQFLGFQTGETLSELFSNAYIYVLPSSIEGLSISLLEAMGYGNCVLTSDIPENVELVGEHGFTFQTGNPDHLRQSMDYLIQHPDVVEVSGKAARVHVEMHYNWDMIAHRTERFFESLLQDNARTGT